MNDWSVEIQPYATGIACGYCGVTEFERCVTSGGNLFDGVCHAFRKREAKERNILLAYHKVTESRVTQVRLTLWYVEKIGCIKLAQSLLRDVEKILL